MHGGADNFSKRIGSAEVDTAACAARLWLRWLDGDEGFPGDVEATCAYTITEDDVLRIEMAAVAGAPTLVNPAHHSYWGRAEAEALRLAAAAAALKCRQPGGRAGIRRRAKVERLIEEQP